jgi:AbiU2
LDERGSIDEHAREMLLRVLENLRRSLYELEAANGIIRGRPTFSDPQIFALAKDALYGQSLLRAARAFDHHPKAVSYFKLRELRPDIVRNVARDRSFDLLALEAFAHKLKKIRDRAIAHDDLDDLRGKRDVWSEHSITTGEFVACLEFAFDALNEILAAEFEDRVERQNYSGQDAEELARLAEKLGLSAKWAQMLY